MLRIYTVSCGRPDFICYQHECFKRHLREDWDFTVINNARHSTGDYEATSIDRACRQLGVASVDVELRDLDAYQHLDPIPVLRRGRYSNANIANAYPLSWAWRHVICRQATDPVLILDSDMFLTRDGRLTELLVDHELAAVPQHRGNLEYAWNGLVLANLPRLPDPTSLSWYCGQVDGVSVDVGGQSARYLREHAEVRLLRLRPAEVPDDPNLDFHPAAYEKIYLGDQQLAVHYRCGSNWNGMTPEYHTRKERWLQREINVAL